MCLLAEQIRKNWEEPLIAQEKIECYKYLVPTDSGGVSPIFQYGYSFGTENYAQLKLVGPYVEDGFHAFQSKSTGVEYILDYNPNAEFALYKCIIPKGAKYYLGMCGDIVSDCMIVVSKYKVTWSEKAIHRLKILYKKIKHFLKN